MTIKDLISKPQQNKVNWSKTNKGDGWYFYPAQFTVNGNNYLIDPKEGY